jgi:hypothetical protein
MNAEPMSGFRGLIVVGSFATALFPVTAGAKILTVTGIGEPASINSATCDVNWHCSTLRDAMNNTASGDSIEFSNVIDGQTIVLEYCTNAATGSEFGPSAFFITGGKGLLIDGITGLTRGITITRDSSAPGCAASGSSPAFRLFDVDAGSSLSLFGLTLKNGLARGGSAYFGGGALGAGGAIFSRGGVVLDQCTLSGNVAQGGSGGNGSVGFGGAGVGADATGINGETRTAGLGSAATPAVSAVAAARILLAALAASAAVAVRATSVAMEDSVAVVAPMPPAAVLAAASAGSVIRAAVEAAAQEWAARYSTILEL